LSEGISTLVLVLLVIGLLKTSRCRAIPWAVGAWVAASIFATSSTGFANPAVTLARSLTSTYAGIDPTDVPIFVGAQLAGGLLALLVAANFFPTDNAQSIREETLV
jgi:glycerol uptake facilitator-like aquaporin